MRLEMAKKHQVNEGILEDYLIEEEEEEEEEDFDESDDDESDDDESDDDESDDDESDDDESDDDESDDDESDDDESDDDESDDEVVITIDGEEPEKDENHEKAPEWVRDLRKTNREQAKKIRMLEAKSQDKSGDANQQTKLGKKPTLEECDFDATEYEKKLESWYDDKRKHDAQLEKNREAEKQQKQAWQAVLDEYESKKSKLKVRDYEDAEFKIQESLDVTQQGIILQGTNNPAMVFYALGTSPNKLGELAAIKDPVKFAFAVADLQANMKVKNRKASTKPEKAVRPGSGRLAGSSNSTLKRLREEASETGDFTKVNAYKRKLAAKKS